jgi:hypothetical protein
MAELRVIAYGGGVQSTALCVLATQDRLDGIMGGPVDAALFANVGDDSEHPDSLRYVAEVMTPWAAERGLPVITLQRHRRTGEVETLWGRLTRDSRSIGIPVRMADTGAPGTRNCTADFKIKVLSKWMKQHGASADNPATVAIGISLDEWHRINNRRVGDHEHPVYPLIDMRLDRAACQRIIAQAGLPVPGKSSCFFCPFHRPQAWAEMRRDRPDLFGKAAALEGLLNERRDKLGKDHVYLTRFGRPIADAIPAAQLGLFADGGMDNGDSCDEGYCFV